MPVSSWLSDIPVPEICFHQYFFDEVKHYGNDIALVKFETNEQYTYGDIVRNAHFVAKSLLALGMEPGEVVILCVPNCPEFVWLFLGISLAGGLVSPLRPLFSIEEMRLQIHDSFARFAFCVPHAMHNVRVILEETKQPYRIVCVGKREVAKGVMTLEDMSNISYTCTVDYPALDPTKDPVFLPYSGGTDGVRRGVCMTHHAFLAMKLSFNNPGAYEQPKHGEYTIGRVSFGTQFGNDALFCSLLNGSTVVTIDGGSPLDLLQLIEAHHIVTVHMSPLNVQLIAAEEQLRRHDLSSLRTIVIGMAPIPEAAVEKLRLLVPTIENYISVYGMTESGLICRSTITATVTGSCGTLCSNMSAMVVDVFSGEELGAFEKGLILIRGPAVGSGYWNNPQATQEAFRHDGWRSTGDIGYYDESERFFIVDRLKTMMKVFGFQVTPLELEEILLTHPSVADAAVISIEDPIAGEKPMAYVVLKPSMKADSTEVKQYVNARVMEYKHLSHVVLAQTLPRSPSGKLLRRMLREAAERVI